MTEIERERKAQCEVRIKECKKWNQFLTPLLDGGFLCFGGVKIAI